MSHDVLCTSNYYIIKENDKEIKYTAAVDVPAHLPFYYNHHDKNSIKLLSRDTHSKEGLGHSLGLGAKLLTMCFWSKLPTIQSVESELVQGQHEI